MSCLYSETDDMQYWDLRQQTPMATIDLSEKAYCMDIAQNLLVRGCGACFTGACQAYLSQVLGTADRKISIVSLDNPGTIWKVSLELDTRGELADIGRDD